MNYITVDHNKGAKPTINLTIQRVEARPIPVKGGSTWLH